MDEAGEKKFIFGSEREGNERFREINFAIEADFGKFLIKKNDAGAVTVVVRNGEGKEFCINSVLPEGYKINGYLEGPTRADTQPGVKEIWLSQIKAEKEGWRYLLVILHEIGHAVYAEQKPEENEEKLRLHLEQSLDDDESTLRRIAVLRSKDERTAWAFAIWQARKLCRELHLPLNKIFPTREDLKEFIARRLRTYKQAELVWIKYSDLPEDKKQKLIDEISKLFVRGVREEELERLVYEQ